MSHFTDTFDSPVGPLSVTVDETGRVRRVTFVATRRSRIPGRSRELEASPSPERCAEARGQILDYLAGRRREFDLPIEAEGTDFERRVWARVRQIGYGETASYGEIATDLDRTGGARAVGRAVGSNPIPLVIPCHRVVGSDGSLTGFGGGLETKKRLLELEASQRSLELEG